MGPRRRLKGTHLMLLLCILDENRLIQGATAQCTAPVALALSFATSDFSPCTPPPQSRSNNHAVREAACACIAEVMEKVRHCTALYGQEAWMGRAVPAVRLRL